MPDWPFQILSKEFVMQLYDDYHEGVFILDRGGRFVYYNKVVARMDGYAQFEIPGKHFIDIYNLNEKNSVSLACLKTQKIVKKAFYYYTRTGTPIHAYCNSYPLIENGELVGALCFTLDFNLATSNLDALTRSGPGRLKDIESPPEAGQTFAHLIGVSKSFQEAVSKAKIAAEHNMPIMLVGETGSGKELFAQAIHNHKTKHQRRFLAVNCPAIPENLLESLLFGTTKGSFTGAMDKAGVFEVASNGTVFLDEINSMPLELQSKLLRVLQEKKVSRVGATREVSINCQIISATGHDPYGEIAAKRLRQDLFYRLGAVLIYIPPLRERTDDIPILAEHFIQKYRHHLSSETQGLTPEAVTWLQGRSWPGNVRELEHLVASAMLFAKAELYLKVENFLSLGHIANEHQANEHITNDHQTNVHQANGHMTNEQSHALPYSFKEHTQNNQTPNGTPPQLNPLEALREPSDSKASEWNLPLQHQEAKRLHEEAERENILKILEKTQGHKAAAATLLGISPQLLNSKLKKYDLNSINMGNDKEKERIIEALERTAGHKAAAAALLGLSRQLLYSKMKKYGITLPGVKGRSREA